MTLPPVQTSLAFTTYAKLQTKYWKKNNLDALCVLSDAWCGLRARSLSQSQIFQWEITLFSKTTLLQRESFFTMFCTINSSIAHHEVSFKLYRFWRMKKKIEWTKPPQLFFFCIARLTPLWWIEGPCELASIRHKWT